MMKLRALLTGLEVLSAALVLLSVGLQLYRRMKK